MSRTAPKTIHQACTPDVNMCQGRDYRHTFNLGPHKLRVSIHHDRYHSPQSWAKIEQWREAGPESWVLVHRLLSSEVVVPTQGQYGLQSFAKVEQALLATARALLDV